MLNISNTKNAKPYKLNGAEKNVILLYANNLIFFLCESVLLMFSIVQRVHDVFETPKQSPVRKHW